jgi:hypothetical protein
MRCAAYLLPLLHLMGCAPQAPIAPSELACPRELPDGSCAGVSRPEICASSYCWQDVACTRVWHVAQGAAPGDGSRARPFASLEPAAAVATPGDCIALASGRYAPASLLGGVSLLGTGADHVEIAGDTTLSVNGGSGGLLRGFALAADGAGLSIAGTAGLRVEQVAVSSARGTAIDARGTTGLVVARVHIRRVQSAAGPNGRYGVGILLAEGASATVTHTVAEHTGTQGILVHDASIALARSVVASTGLHGVAMVRDTSPKAPVCSVEGSVLDQNRGVGLLALGVELTASANAIANTSYGDGVARGISALGGRVKLVGNHVHHGQGLGVALEQVAGLVAQNRVEHNASEGIVLSQISGPGLVLADNRVAFNEAAGIRCTASTATITGGRVTNTRTRALIDADGAGYALVGDGIQLLNGSTVSVSGVALQDNQRIGLIVDASRAAVMNVTIGGSQVPLVVQNAALAQQTFHNVTDTDGVVVAPHVPPSPYGVGG